MHDGPWRQKKISWELHASAAFSLSKNPSVVWVQNSLSHVVSVRKNDAARKKNVAQTLARHCPSWTTSTRYIQVRNKFE